MAVAQNPHTLGLNGAGSKATKRGARPRGQDNPALASWVAEVVALAKPDNVYWCSGSAREFTEMARLMTQQGVAIPLNSRKRPNSLLVRSDPADVARVEDRTYICCAKREDAGPTNNWVDPAEMRDRLKGLFNGSMVGRTLYAIPYRLAPAGSPFSKLGVELTDSAYVVANMHLMARVSASVLDEIAGGAEFVRGVHSVGAPLAPAAADTPWPCNAEHKYICHFPETREIWSFGSGYGGNALLAKKCHALRIASVQARDEGWMAEHMLIMKLTSPEGAVKHFCAAFPSACGKTNLAMMEPPIPGWKVETLGDDIAWLRFGADGRLYAINPEAGFFGVAPGTSMGSNPNALRAAARNSIFTNCGLAPDGDVWWEGMTAEPPKRLIDWKRRPWTPDCGRQSSHPNARFTSPARQCPVIAPEWESPEGVPIDGILFGGRRAHLIPLVTEAFDWVHGVFMGATASSETTSAAAGATGSLRRDPMAMLPFCGYNMGDYLAHWLKIGERPNASLPRIFYVNWFRRDANGRFLWPGYGENARVLKWVFQRCDGQGGAVETPIGVLPEPEALDTAGLSLPPANLDELLHVDMDAWAAELPLIREHFARFGDHLPAQLAECVAELEKRLNEARQSAVA